MRVIHNNEILNQPYKLSKSEIEVKANYLDLSRTTVEVSQALAKPMARDLYLRKEISK